MSEQLAVESSSRWFRQRSSQALRLRSRRQQLQCRNPVWLTPLHPGMPLTSAVPEMSYPGRSGIVSTSSRRQPLSRAVLASFSRSGWSRRTATISPSPALSSQLGPSRPTATHCLLPESSSQSGPSSVGTRHAALLRGLFHRSGTWTPRPAQAERLLEPSSRSATFVPMLLRWPLLPALCRQLVPFKRLATRSQQAFRESFSQSVLFRLSLAPWQSFADSFSQSDRFSRQEPSERLFAALFVR